MDPHDYRDMLGTHYDGFGTTARSTRRWSRLLSGALVSTSVLNGSVLDHPVTSYYVYGALLGGVAIAAIGELGARFGERMQDQIIRYATDDRQDEQ